MGGQEGERAQEPCRLRPMAFTARPHPRPGVKFRPLGPKNLRTDSGKPRQGVKCRPLGPKNLRTGNGKLARPQRRLCQTICKIYPARTLVALLWVVAHRHHPRLGPRKLRQGGSGGEGHQCYHLEPPVISPARRTASRSTESAVAPPPSHATSAPPEGQTNGHRWGNMRRGGAIYTSMSSASTRPSGSSQGPS